MTVLKNELKMKQVALENEYIGDQVLMEETTTHSYKYSISLLFLFSMLIFAVWAGTRMMQPDFMPIKSVGLEGEFQRLSPEKLKGIVVATVRGGFFNVNVDVIQSVLMQNPWVQQVNVIRKWPDSLIVQITERSAVARWADKGLIGMTGKLFTPDKDTYPEGLPVLQGPDFTNVNMLEEYRYFSKQLSETDYVIGKVILNERRAWSVELVNGPLLVLGRNDIRDRMQRFVVYAISGLENNLMEIEKIDLRYTNGFAVRWKSDSNNTDLRQDHHG